MAAFGALSYAVAILVGLVLTTTPSSGQRPCQFLPGVSGVCRDIRQCPSVLRDLRNRVKFPTYCGTFNGRFPDVCCAEGGGVTPSPVFDITAPIVNFECGRTGASSVIGDIRSGLVQPSSVPSLAGRPAFSTAAEFEMFLIGGVNSNRGAWPWMALIGTREASGNLDWFCAGMLINNNWILTAAHCIDHAQTGRSVDVIRLGEHNYEDPLDGAPHQDIEVASTILYPEYSAPQAYHDLALIRLARSVRFESAIQPVCLPWGRETDRNLEGTTVTLTGWGDQLFGGSRSPVLQEVEVTVFPSSDCDASYRNNNDYTKLWPQGIGAETICSGDRDGGKDACQGDSGGPIVSKDSRSRYTLAGVVSTGFGCGAAEFPGIYVNARRPEYLSWIKQVAFSS